MIAPEDQSLISETKSNTPSVETSSAYRTPSVARRFWANCVDTFIVCSPWVFFLKELISTREFNVSWPLFIFIVAIGYTYQILFLKLNGATLGKMLLGLRVISVDPPDQKLSWSQAALRVFVNGIGGYFLSLLPYAVAFLNPHRRHVIDLVARTRVIENEGAPRDLNKRAVLGWILIVVFGLVAIGKGAKFVLPKDESAAEEPQVVTFDSSGVHFKVPKR